jgi:Na+-transporting methylmalonyl-CoA/oxaloacetate decarboxylase gamma subunit
LTDFLLDQGFFIFSLAITLCLMKSTFVFLILGILVNCTWLATALANLITDEVGNPNNVLRKVGGAFGVLVAFTAWYLMYEGLANKSNRYARTVFVSAKSPMLLTSRRSAVSLFRPSYSSRGTHKDEAMMRCGRLPRHAFGQALLKTIDIYVIITI